MEGGIPFSEKGIVCFEAKMMDDEGLSDGDIKGANVLGCL